MDWNWYFSTLAQSSAAIVGIISGLLMTKHISNQAAFNDRLRKCKDLERTFNSLKLQADELNILWYNEVITEHALTEVRQYHIKDITPIDEDSIHRIILRHYYNIKFTPYKSYWEVSRLIEKYINIGLTMGRDRTIGSLITAPDHTQQLLLDDARKAIDNNRRSVIDHIGNVKEFISESSLKPESSSIFTFMIIICALLFSIGVIAPLLFLPISSPADILQEGHNLAKYILLLIVAIGFNGVLLYLLLSERILYIKDDTLSALDKFCKPENYSYYYGCYYSNLSILDSYRKEQMSASGE